MPVKPKRRPNKQHDVRGASLARIGKELEKQAKFWKRHLTPNEVILIVAYAIQREARKVSKLR